MKTPLFGIWFGVFAGLASVPATGAPWNRHVIDAVDPKAGKRGADGVRLGDANGDGRLDVVTGWENGDAIRVCLHPGPARAEEPWPAVTVGRVSGAEDAVFADLDGDGALDVVSCAEGRTRSVLVHWAPADRSAYLEEASWTTDPIPALAGKAAWMYCLPWDVDGDGRLDLVVGSKGEGGTVGWLKQPAAAPRDLRGWVYREWTGAGWIMSIVEADLDGDGDRDLVYSDRKGGRSGVWWLERRRGAELGVPRRLGFAGEEVMFIDLADLEGDRRPEIVAAIRPDRIGVLRRRSGQDGAWEATFPFGPLPQDRFGTAKAVQVGDAEGDGRKDLAVTCENAQGDRSGCLLVPWPAGGADPGAFPGVAVGGPEGVKFDRVEWIDLDEDGDPDLLTCEEQEGLGVIWYENPAVD